MWLTRREECDKISKLSEKAANDFGTRKKKVLTNQKRYVNIEKLPQK